MANTLRLLNLPESTRQMLASGQLTAGHARALLAFDDPAFVARMVADRQMSVRDVEDLAKNQREAKETRTSKVDSKALQPRAQDANLSALTKDLSDALGLEVTIKTRSGIRGSLTIQYSTLDQLERLRRLLTHRP